MTKHKHYEMIVTKAANMDSVTLYKEGVGCYWSVRLSQDSTHFSEGFDFFLCLPQHKEACLHWLNGGDVLLKDFKEDTTERMLSSSAFVGWHESTVFMSEEAQIRIAPKKETRWVVIDAFGNAVPTLLKDEQSLENAKELMPNCSFHRVEVEVQ